MNKNQIGGLRILARRVALTESDWFDLLEERRRLFEPHLREMTLKSLGDLRIVRDRRDGARSERPLRLGAVVEKSSPTYPHKYFDWAELTNVEGSFPLDTRGIFPNDDVFYNGHFKFEHVSEAGKAQSAGLITRFWGLTRNNEWIEAECVERYFDQPRFDKPGRKDRISEVTNFSVYQSTPQEICRDFGFTPHWIWHQLGEAAKTWLKQRQELLAGAERLVEIVKQEQMLLDIIE